MATGRKIGDAFVAVKPEVDKGFGSDLEKNVTGRVSIAGRKAGLGFGASFRTGLAPVIAGLGTVFAASGAIDFLKGTVAEATEAAKVGAQTTAVLKSTGNAAGVSAKQIGDLATAISNKTGIDDEAIQSNENLLLTFTNVRNEVGKGNDIFSQATQTITDMSAALGQDGKSSAIQLGKALNDPIKGITALQRVGVTFTEQQKKAIAADVKRGDTLKAQKTILAELNKEFGGSAAAVATPAEKAQVAWKNFQETLGGAVLPILNGVLGAFTPLLAIVSENAAGIAAFGKRVGDALGFARKVVGDFIGILRGDGVESSKRYSSGFLAGMQSVAKGAKAAFGIVLTVIRNVAAFFTGTIIPVALNLARTFGPLLAAGLAIGLVAFRQLSDLLKPLGTVLRDVFGFVQSNKTTFQALAVGILAVVAAFKLWKLAIQAWQLVTKIAIAVQTAFNVVMDANPIGIVVLAIAGLVAAILYLTKHSAAFRDFWKAVWHGIQVAFHAVVNFLKGDLSGLVLLILGPLGAVAYVALHWKLLWDGIVKGFHATVSFLRGLFADAIDLVLGFFGSIIHGAASAFGWVPGIGGKLKKAAKAFDKFRDDVNNSLRGIKPKTVPVTIQLGVNKAAAGPLHGIGVLAKGGIVKATPGGSLNILGEAGQDELVIPLPRGGTAASADPFSTLTGRTDTGGAVTVENHFHFPGSVIGSERELQNWLVKAYDKAVRQRRIRVAT